MEFARLTSKEKFEYIITNYDKVIDAEATKAAYKFGFHYTKEEFKSSMYFYILTRIKYFKQLHGLGVVVGVNCRQAVREHIKENTYNRIDYSYHIKKYRYEKEHNCILGTKEDICNALGIKSETYYRHFALKFNSIDAQIENEDTSDRAKSMSEFLVDENINVENEVIDKILDNHNKLSTIINSCINSLSEKESTIIRYRYFNNLSYDEIAKIENISVKSVDNAIDRAKNNLRAMLLSQKHIEIVKNFI